MEKIRYWDLPRVLLVICFVLLLLAPWIWVASIQRGGLWGNLDFVLKIGVFLLGPIFAAILLTPPNKRGAERDIEIHWGDTHRESPVLIVGQGILALLCLLWEARAPFLVRWFGEGVFGLFGLMVWIVITLLAYGRVRKRTSYAD